MESKKTIDTLVDDIKDVLSNPQDYEFTDDLIEHFTDGLAGIIIDKLADRKPQKPGRALRMSAIGTPDRKLWYQNNCPDEAEPISPEAYLKFLYGDIIEELVLMLAKVAGHTVTGEQRALEIDGVVGHQDCEIDGELVDVKSTSSYGFHKFNKNGLREDDPFHYLDQLGSYHTANPDVRKDRAHFFAVDKQLGKMCLDTYEPNGVDYEAEIKRKKEMLEDEMAPKKCYFPVKDGASGNMKLDTACSYCSFKKKCWPGMRTFLYSSGPRFLTTVKKVPNVPEV